MSIDYIFKQRNPLEEERVSTSKVLLYGYKMLSGDAKITFQIIKSYDWKNKETGESKGYAFPAVKTIAEIRGVSERTIYRHINELIKVKLLTRQQRSHKASYLYIEDVSEEEKKLYLEKYINKTTIKKSIDSFVNRLTRGRLTELSVDNIKQEEKKKSEINVNDNFKTFKERGGGKTVALRDILMQYGLKRSKKVKKPDLLEKRDYLAEEIAEKLNDQKSLGCFRVIAEKIPQNVIFEVLSSVKETAQAGKIKQSRGALFVEIMKKYAGGKGINLGFKNTNTND